MFIRTSYDQLINVDHISEIYKDYQKYDQLHTIKIRIRDDMPTVICQCIDEQIINEQFNVLLEGIAKNASLIDFYNE